MRALVILALALSLCAAFGEPASAQTNSSVTGCLVREVWGPNSLRFTVLDAAGTSHAFAFDRGALLSIAGSALPPALTFAQTASWAPFIASLERAATTQRKISIDVANNRAFGVAIDWNSSCS